MKKYVFLFTLFLVQSCGIFENEQEVSELCNEVFTVVQQPPLLIGGIAGIQEQIVYPELAVRAGIEGRVITQFIVNKKGSVIEPQVVRGIGGGADEEALRVTKLAKFEPGSQGGQLVCVQYSLPITFSLPN